MKKFYKSESFGETMYTISSRVRFSELDSNGMMKPSSVINYFQDCSTFQSEDLNLGLSYLQSKNRAWILNAWQLIFYRYAKLGENITINTWPYDFKGFYGFRNFILKTSTGETLAAANSIWIYMDTSTGKPVKLPDGYNDYELDPPYQMEYLGRKIDINSDFTELPSFPVLKQNIDTYNHVNNGQYIKMAEEYLPDNFIASKMRVEYRMSAVYGDIIVPRLSKSYNKYTIILANTLGSPYSIIEFKA